MDVSSLTWAVDSAGYEFSPDGVCIRRRGGAMREYQLEYRPAPVDSALDAPPSPHFVFADLNRSQRSLLKKQPPGKRRATEPFWSKVFPDDRATLLAFVNEYGFLGYLNSGPEVREESAEHLLRLQTQLSQFYAFGMESPDPRAGQSPEQAFNGYVQRIGVSNLSWRVGPAADGSTQVQAVPQSFVSWMWLRAARDMTENIDWHFCLQCGKPMSLGDAYSRSAERCSASCSTLFNRSKSKRKGAKK